MCLACAVAALWLGVPPTTRLELDRLATAREAVDLWSHLRNAGIGTKSEFWERVDDQHAAAVRRLADLERQWDRSPAGRVAAARRWYVLTREHDLYQTSRNERGLIRDGDRLSAKLHRLDAELELHAAMAALPPGGPPVLAPFAPAPADFRAAVTEVRGYGVTFQVPEGSRLKRFDRLVLDRPGAVVELVVLDAEPLVSGGAIALPTAAGVPPVRVGDRLRP